MKVIIIWLMIMGVMEHTVRMILHITNGLIQEENTNLTMYQSI